MKISLDTETTGLDWAHGALPFLVTTCDEDGNVLFWEWDVDPLTRMPEIPDGDLEQVQDYIDSAEVVYLHNAKFDAHQLKRLGVHLPWARVRDTLCMAHLLGSNLSHTLGACCVQYLGEDITPLEREVERVTKLARDVVKRDEALKGWRIAAEGAPGMPSVDAGSKRDEDKPWKNDMWLPRALLKHGVRGYPTDGWETACREYANGDSSCTLPLGIEMDRLVDQRGLRVICDHRQRLVLTYFLMEEAGITAIGSYTDGTVQDYQQHIAEVDAEMVAIAAQYGHALELAQGAAINDNMRQFIYGDIVQTCPECGYVHHIKHWHEEFPSAGHCQKCVMDTRKRKGKLVKTEVERRPNLALPFIYNQKTAGPSLNTEAMEQYLATTDGDASDFLELLADRRRHGTAVSYMEQYRSFWFPVNGKPGYYRVHASVNPFGTDHLRSSSSNPNMQNTSSKEVVGTRACFGPAPGREWYSADYESIEARIPAYECGEEKMLAVYEAPDEPPYWGNLYYLTASLLYPEEFFSNNTSKVHFKTDRPKLYKQTKFFVLAKQYGAGRKKGDLLSKVHDSYDLVDGNLPKLAALQAHYLRFAEREGYVETLPDRTVDPERGYPILASRTDDGRVLSTTPFNYHVSGTACWCKCTGLLRCSHQLAKWREEDGFDGYVVMDVHDELVFDFPRGPERDSNLWRALVLKKLMEQSGEDLIPRIRTPVALKYHDVNWASGVPVSAPTPAALLAAGAS